MCAEKERWLQVVLPPDTLSNLSAAVSQHLSMCPVRMRGFLSPGSVHCLTCA